MTALIKELLEDINIGKKALDELKASIIDLSNAADWFGSKNQRDWLFKAEASVGEAVEQLYLTWDAVEHVRADVSKREEKK